jgi:hypothetical protein
MTLVGKAAVEGCGSQRLPCDQMGLDRFDPDFKNQFVGCEIGGCSKPARQLRIRECCQAGKLPHRDPALKVVKDVTDDELIG